MIERDSNNFNRLINLLDIMKSVHMKKLEIFLCVDKIIFYDLFKEKIYLLIYCKERGQFDLIVIIMQVFRLIG